MSDLQTMKIEYQNNIAVLTLSRPEALNAINSQLMTELEVALAGIAENSVIRCLVVTGAGKAFVAGADIKEMENYSPDEALKMSERGQQIFNRIEVLKIPVIAAVNGFALGGGLELAMACDFILASEKAKFGLPEVGLGLIPGYGGTQRLSRQVGLKTAGRIALSGEIFGAAQGLSWGLFTEVFPAEELMPAVFKLAETLSSKSPRAIELCKRAISEGFDLNQAEGLEIEAQKFKKSFESKDHVEGIQAFLEKRSPNFTGE